MKYFYAVVSTIIDDGHSYNHRHVQYVRSTEDGDDFNPVQFEIDIRKENKFGDNVSLHISHYQEVDAIVFNRVNTETNIPIPGDMPTKYFYVAHMVNIDGSDSRQSLVVPTPIFDPIMFSEQFGMKCVVLFFKEVSKDTYFNKVEETILS